ncbi:hypothetical protein SSX86_027928 [Deinandra increscens subsp. villosa]|uniref:Uncharacterized protein n=1 Tax=Deinandra increscens subsp. villosa TaxID=3103831 RepID=A0AAP0GJ63_9ASTR
MASSSNSILFTSFFIVLCCDNVSANGCYQSIISFGDSISDTGNRQQLGTMYPDIGFDCAPPCSHDGRCSNGRLIVDFLAESLGLPLITSYMNGKGNDGLVAGTNYAVSGASTLDSSFLKAGWSGNDVINASLGVQLAWFKQSLPSMCGNTSDCRDYIGRSLIILGPFGSNDYNHMLTGGKVIDEVKPYVRLVVDVIISAVNELIEMGAKTIIVPGNFPWGCFPSVLTMYASDGDEYDPTTSCLIKFNEFVEYHNTMLQTKLNQTRELSPNATIIYADNYKATMQIYLSPDEYGFTNSELLKACYGGGGPFNFNLSIKCGDPSMTMCDEPDTHVSWDGIHFTEATYKLVAKNLFQGPYTRPEFYSLCPMPSAPQMEVGLSSSM